MINTWPGWENAGLLGEGSFGKVYKIKREEFGQVYEAALKVITIPASQSDVHAAYEEGMDEESVTKYFRSFVEDIVAEFALMSQLKGNSNIVSYEDHMVVQHENEVGWDILIRMELLTALPAYIASHPMTEEDILRLGIHMTQALELCRNRGIIHRDIKPENIFVSKDGNFKLGDFGVARVAEKTVTVMSRKGTYNYMAPEVFKGEKYGYTADICSLGLVLYRYLNNNRTPFLPPYPQPIQYSDREKALEMRMQGETIPAPVHGSEALQKVILKACAYRPEERYTSPEEMKKALELVRIFEEVSEQKDISEAKEETVPEAKKVVDPSKKEISAVLEEQETKQKEIGVLQSEKEKPEEKEITEKRIEKKRRFEKKKSEKEDSWLHTATAGVLVYLTAFIVGTLLLNWDSLYSAQYSMKVHFYDNYSAVRAVACLLAIDWLPVVGIWRQWPKLWNAAADRKKIHRIWVGLLLVIGFGLGMLHGLYPLWSILGTIKYYTLQAVIGIALAAAAGLLWFVMEKKQWMHTRGAGMVITGMIFVFAFLFSITKVYGYSGSVDFYTLSSSVNAYKHYNSETPFALIQTFFSVFLLIWIFMGAGYLWTYKNKLGKGLWLAYVAVIGVLIVFPAKWAAQIYLDLWELPIVTVIGILLGLTAAWGSKKAAALIRRKKEQSQTKNREQE